MPKKTIFNFISLEIFTGEVECRMFYDTYKVNSSKKPFYLLGKPSISVHPTTVSVENDESTTITCTGFVVMTNHSKENDTLTFSWTKDDNALGQGKI